MSSLNILIKRLWTESEVSFEGRHYQIKNAFSAPKPIQQLPPIFIGGTGKKRILKMVAKYADYCNFGFFIDPNEIPELLKALEDHCNTVSRDYESVGKSFFASVMIAKTEEELNKLMNERAKLRNMSLDVYKKTLGKGVFYGTPEYIQEKFEQLTQLGFDYFQIMFPYPLDYEQSKIFAEFVLPRFK